MKTTLYLTPTDCFRPPVVMQWAHHALQSGQRVGLISPDQAESIRVDDDWLSAICQVDGDVEELVDLKPDLAILDDLVFPDVAGLPTSQWWVTCGWSELSLSRLERLFDRLRDGGCSALLLVSRQDTVSAEWQDWLEHREFVRHIEVISPASYPRRDWQMMDEHGKPYRSCGFAQDMLAGPGGPLRTLQARFSHPSTEVLLALVSEHCAAQYECNNPEDPQMMNGRSALMIEIVIGHIKRSASSAAAGTALADLLEDLGELYDLLSDCQLMAEQIAHLTAAAEPKPE